MPVQRRGGEVGVGEVVDLQAYRESLPPAPDRMQEPGVEEPARSTIADGPEGFGWLVVERDDDGRPVRWFHPGLVAQLGYIPQTPEWIFLDDTKQIRAWHALEPGEVAEALSRRVLPEPELAVPFRT